MKKHIEVFHYLTMLKDQFDLNLKEVIPTLERFFDLPYMPNIQAERFLDIYLRFPPDNTQYAQYLKDIGYSPGFIAKYLSITPGTVSYHLSRIVKNEYINAQAEQYARNCHVKQYKE